MNIFDFDWNSLQQTAQIFGLLCASASIVITLGALIASHLLRRRSAPLRYGILFTGMTSLTAIPLLIVLGMSQVDWFTSTQVETLRLTEEQVAQTLTQHAQSETENSTGNARPFEPGIGSLLILGWGIGIMYGLIRLVRGLLRLRGQFACTPWQPYWWTPDVAQSLAAKIGLKRFPLVLQSPKAPMPMVLGFVQPRIVVPSSTTPLWGQQEWEAVLLHEAAHIVRRDPLASLMQKLVVIVFWWSPLVHRLARRLSDLRETICDDYALEGIADSYTLAKVLVDTAEHLVQMRMNPVPVALLDSTHGGLEERITRLLNKETRPMTKISLAGKLFVAGLMALCCLAVMTATAVSQAPAPQKKIQIKIVVDGKELELTEDLIQDIVARKQNHNEVRLLNADTTLRLFETNDKQPTPDELRAMRFIVGIVDPKTGEKKLAKFGDKVVTQIVDSKTGEITYFTIEDIAEYKHGGKIIAKAKFTDIVSNQNQQADHDSLKEMERKIENLVRQAEDLHPGSGTKVRQLLQDELKKRERNDTPNTKDIYPRSQNNRLESKDLAKSQPGATEIRTPDGKVHKGEWKTVMKDGQTVLVFEISDDAKKSTDAPNTGLRFRIIGPNDLLSDADKKAKEQSELAAKKVLDRAREDLNNHVREEQTNQKQLEEQKRQQRAEEKLESQIRQLRQEVDRLKTEQQRFRFEASPRENQIPMIPDTRPPTNQQPTTPNAPTAPPPGYRSPGN